MSFNNANLTDSFNHFKGFFEFATMGILVIDSDGNISAINPFAQKQFGYEEEEILGKNIEIIIPHNFYIRPGQQEKIKKNLKVVGGKNELNLYGIKKNGSHFPVDARVCHYPNHGGLYTVVFIADVSQNKTSESELEQLNFDLENTVTNRTRDLQEAMQQLEKSNDRLEKVLIFQKTLIDNAGAMIIATDKDGIIRLFNPEAEAKLGYLRSEIIDKKTPVLFHTKNDLEKRKKELVKLFDFKSANNFDVLVEKARRNIHEEEQYNFVAKNGELFPVSLTITAIRNNMNNITGFIGIAIDISERIKAEKELRKVQHLFLQLLHNYPDGIISIIDTNFKFVYTGGELHKRLHADISHLIGKDIYPRFPAPLRKIIYLMLENVFQEKVMISDFELPFPILNHTYIMDAFPLMEEDGSLNYLGVIIKNISKIKRAEEGLRVALTKERNLGELKSSFVSMASHEFRTPLSTVLSSAYLIEKYVNTDDQPKREKHLQRIISSVNLLTDILNDFLSLGKMEEGKLKAKFAEFNLQDLIQNILEEMKNNLKKDQIINYHHEGKTNIFLDKSLLKHIVMNLISNASKFSAASSTINIRTTNSEEKMSLTVTDNGIGISEEDQKHLLERFFRGSNAGNIQGTGLGLHIISKYAEMMNGKIKCKSQLDKGTEFTVTFNTKKKHHEKNIIDRRQ